MTFADWGRAGAASLPIVGILLAAQPAGAQDTAHVVIAATTDVHGHVYHWDYIADREALWGITRAATLLDSLRRVFPGAVVTVDAGDLIQGNPFATYYSAVQPVEPHPVVDALNGARYDVATPGNHEFNWGLETFERAMRGAAFPIVSGNIYRLPRDTLAFQPFVVLPRAGVRVGITGFTTPGAMVWDREHLAGRLAVRRIVPEAARVLDALARTAELRVVLIHSGMDAPSSYDTTGVGAENVAAQLATLPTPPHLVVVGHSHETLRDSVIGDVHFIQPAAHARTLAIAHVSLVRSGDAWTVREIRGEQIPLGHFAPDRATARRLESAHQRVRVWVSEPLAMLEGDWSARFARAEDTPLIDFVNAVQRQASGAQLSSAAAFDPSAMLGPGEVRLRDLSAVYPYENTLRAIRITGGQLAEYLEQSVAYFRTYRPGAPIINDSVPGFNYDIVSGVEYVIDLTYPVGSRIRQLTYQGRLVQPTDTFTLAINSYRQSGGGGFTMLRDAPVVYDRGENIRDLLIEHVRELDVLRADDYSEPSWRIMPEAAAAAVRQAFAQGRR